MIIFIGLVVAIETWKRLSLCSFLYLYQLVVNSIWFSRSFSVKCYLIKAVGYTEQSSQRAVFNLQAEGSRIIARQGGTSWTFFYKLIKFFERRQLISILHEFSSPGTGTLCQQKQSWLQKRALLSLHDPVCRWRGQTAGYVAYVFKSLRHCQGSAMSFWEIHSSSLLCQQVNSVVQTVWGCPSKVNFIWLGSDNNDRMG